MKFKQLSLLFIFLLCNYCYIVAQTVYKLDKTAKRELQVLQKEGWTTLDPNASLVEQFTTWHQMESAMSDIYTVHYFEKEYPSLSVVEKFGWNEAYAQIRVMEHAHTRGNVQIRESMATNADGKQEEHSDISMTQRTSNRFTSNNDDIQRVMGIYKVTANGVIVKLVVAKRNK